MERNTSAGLSRAAPLVAGASVFLFLGLIYAWSIFVRPLEAEFGWTRAETSGIFSLCVICFCFGGIAGGLILKWKSERFIMRLAALLLFFGFFLSSRVESLPAIYISYGFLCGFSVGLAYIINISTVTKWFPDKVGFASGILLMCYGVGGMVLGAFASALIAYMGWRVTFMVLGVAAAVILFFGSAWIVPPGPEVVLPELKVKSSRVEEKGLSLPAGEMLKRPSFWLYFTWVTILSSSGLVIMGHASVCAQDLGADVALATFIAGLIAVGNGGGRILFGLNFDRFGRSISMKINNIVIILACGILSLSVYLGSPPIFLVGGVLLGIGFGGGPSNGSAFINLFYGREHYPLNFSILNMCAIPAAFIGPLMAGAVKTATGSYLTVFIILMAATSCVYVLQLFIKKP